MRQTERAREKFFQKCLLGKRHIFMMFWKDTINNGHGMMATNKVAECFWREGSFVHGAVKKAWLHLKFCFFSLL